MVKSYQRREESSSNGVTSGEKKNVMRHELKVPKAGQLESVKASRIRKLSSNQLTGFKIRNTPQGSHNASEPLEDAASQEKTSYGLVDNCAANQKNGGGRKALDSKKNSN